MLIKDIDHNLMVSDYLPNPQKYTLVNKPSNKARRLDISTEMANIFTMTKKQDWQSKLCSLVGYNFYQYCTNTNLTLDINKTDNAHKVKIYYLDLGDFSIKAECI